MSGQPFHIDNAEERASSYGGTFQLPRLERRRALTPGSHAKLLFRDHKDDLVCERMWVLVKEVRDGRYHGVLDNDPAELKRIKDQDPVVFGPEHICDIEENN